MVSYPSMEAPAIHLLSANQNSSKEWTFNYQTQCSVWAIHLTVFKDIIQNIYDETNLTAVSQKKYPLTLYVYETKAHLRRSRSLEKSYTGRNIYICSQPIYMDTCFLFPRNKRDAEQDKIICYLDQFRICSSISSICLSAVASSWSSAMICAETVFSSFISFWNFSHSSSIGSLYSTFRAYHNTAD